LPCRVELADRRRRQRIEPQAIMVVEVRVAQRQAKHPLPDRLAHTVLDKIRVATIEELPGEPLHDVGLRLHFTEKQSAPIGTDGSAVEFSDDLALAQRVKFHLLFGTLCH
jgi:hypothetical protein